MKRNRTVRRLGCFAIAVALSANGFASVAAADDVTLEDIYAAWRAREQRVRSLRFEWAELQTTPKGARTADLQQAARFAQQFGSRAQHVPDVPDGPVPPEDVTHELKWSISIDGQRMHLSIEGPSWQGAVGRFEPQRYVTVFDGTVAKSCYLTHYDPLAHEAYPAGFVHEKPRHPETGNYHLAPIVMTYRALNPALSLHADETWRLTPQRAMIDGESCRIMELERPPGAAGNVVVQWWVDPQRDWCVRRHAILRDGRPLLQLDIALEPDAQAGWRPATWRSVDLAPSTQEVHEACEATVTAFEINPRIPIDEFQFEFPPGTRVRAPGDTHYIVRDDGSDRPILEEERQRGASYDELVASDVGEAGLERVRGDDSPIVWIAVGLAGALALFAAGRLWWRRGRASA